MNEPSNRYTVKRRLDDWSHISWDDALKMYHKQLNFEYQTAQLSPPKFVFTTEYVTKILQEIMQPRGIVAPYPCHTTSILAGVIFKLQ